MTSTRTLIDRRPGAGSSDPDWLADGLHHVWPPYGQSLAHAPLPVVSTHGSRLRLACGTELVDGVASWWSACHGYNHPAIRRAVADQLERMPHVMFAGLAHEPGYTLATRLAKRLPAGFDRVFFSDSGSVAVEVALKMALQFWIQAGEPERSRFLAFRNAYHGDTLMTMSLCDPASGMHASLAHSLPRQLLADLPSDADSIAAYERLLDEHGDTCAAVIVEPLVQGAGGMRFHSPATLCRIVEMARARDVLVVFDEVFTGFGRTGTEFAFDQIEAKPDIVTLSKGLTAGTLPLAATAASERIYRSFRASPLMHGPTYMANPLACAAAHASLDLFDAEPRLARIAAIERQLADELGECACLPRVHDVRVKGAIGVVQLDEIEDPIELRERFVERGAWVRPFRDVIYLAPPFVIDEVDLRRLTSAVVEVTAELSRETRRSSPRTPSRGSRG